MGISWHKRTSVWHAYIWVGTGQVSLGQYRDEEEAALAHDVGSYFVHGR